MEENERKLVELERCFRTVFEGEEGEKVLEYLDNNFSLNHSCIYPEQYETYCALGQRSVMLHIHEWLDGKWAEPVKTETKSNYKKGDK